MRRLGRSAWLFVVPIVMAAAPAAGASPRGEPEEAAIRDQYIVALHPDESANSVAADHGRRYGARVRHVYRAALQGYSAAMSADAAARAAEDPRVESVVQDRPVSVFAQEVPTGVRRVGADRSPTAAIDGVPTGVDVDVAVLDTGVDLDHPDLNLAGSVNCVPHEPDPDDLHGHGTHVAGTVGAIDNGFGVVGVAPGARVWSVKVLDRFGSGAWSSVICGVDWVTANAATIEVANMSLGGGGSDGPCSSDPLHKAVCKSVRAGVTYAVAAGNSASDAERFVPATFRQVLTVSALADFDGKPRGKSASTCRTDDDDTFANFSNYGADVDLIAPGVCILSTARGGGYELKSGTSMASPHVAGAAALHKANHPSDSPSDVKRALRRAANRRWFTGTDPDGSGDKLLNVAAF